MINSIMQKNKLVKNILVAIFWLAVWEAVSLLVNNSILIVGPWEVIKCLTVKIREQEFWVSILGSLSDIAKGFLLGSLLGLILAVLSYNIQFMGYLLTPFMAFVKSAPVASFIVLFLIWWHSDVLSVAVSTCVVLPQAYISMAEGLAATDKNLIEMADSYKLSLADRIAYIYRPSVVSYMEAAIKISVGMAWKSGVAAEIIGTPEGSVGERLYMSKIYLDTEGVLAWTSVIIILSMACEFILLKLYKMFNGFEPKCAGSRRKRRKNDCIIVKNICKSFGENEVLKDFSAEYRVNSPVLLDWKSGSGKTTLLKIISGGLLPDAGCVEGNAETVMLFQEDRLCERYSAIKNVEMVTGNREKARDELLKVLDENDIYKPVCELSGGQKRRVALVRAAVCEADAFLLDEPFNGLDAATRETARKYIENAFSDKIVIIASHIS